MHLAPLSDAQLRAFRHDGFTAVGRIFDDRTLELLRREEARLRPDHDPNAPGARTLFRNQVCHCSEVVRRTCTLGAHIPWTTQILGPDVLFWWVQFVTKLPEAVGDRSVFHWHQDCGYQDVRPTPMTIWVALDDVDERNGCIWVVPGSHRAGLLPHLQKPGSWHLEAPAPDQGVPMRLRAGEAVAFTGYTLHRSLENRSDAPRRAFFMEYTHAEAIHPANGSALRSSPDAWMVAGEVREPVGGRAPAAASGAAELAAP
jgi:ectoine hydroxylase-related dioxygenase (phytanoyl-CoA dioxygenase family)